MTTRLTTDSSAFRVEITAVTDIDAPASDVWAVLADTDAYPDWNPLVRRFEGDLVVGERITVDLTPTDKPAQTIRPRIVEHTPGESFTWLGRIGLPNVLDGRHHFRVEALTPTTSRLVQHEVLSGALVPLFRTMLTVDTPRAFAALNDALAERATQRASR